jgi:hypothetical protein
VAVLAHRQWYAARIVGSEPLRPERRCLSTPRITTSCANSGPLRGVRSSEVLGGHRRTTTLDGGLCNVLDVPGRLLDQGGQAIFEAGVVLVRELAGNSDRRVAGVQGLQWDAVVRRDHVTRESQKIPLPEVVLMPP